MRVLSNCEFIPQMKPFPQSQNILFLGDESERQGQPVWDHCCTLGNVRSVKAIKVSFYTPLVRCLIVTSGRILHPHRIYVLCKNFFPAERCCNYAFCPSGATVAPEQRAAVPGGRGQPQLQIGKRRGCVPHSTLHVGPGQEARNMGGRTPWGTWDCCVSHRLGFRRARGEQKHLVCVFYPKNPQPTVK